MSKQLLLRSAGAVVFLVCVGVLSSGCKKDDSSTTPGGGTSGAPTIASFTATPSTLPAAGDTVTLGWHVSGATSLSIAPTPGSITPPDSIGSRKLFVSATTTFTLTATNANGSVTANAAVTVGGGGGTITVNGKVVGINNQPVPSAPVVITGKAAVTTDVNGQFSVSGVTTPYDVTVVVSTTKQALVYKGLTRSDPTLIFFGVTPGTAQSASLSGTISGGGGYPEPAGRTTRVAFSSPETGGGTTAAGATGAYGPTTMTWYGPSTTTGTIYSLQWDYVGSVPVTYHGFGSKTGVALSNGGSFSGQDVTMSGVAAANLAGSITVPSAYTLTSKSLAVNFGGMGSISLLNDATSTLTFSYVTPNASGATLLLSANATKPTGEISIGYKAGLAPNTSGVALAIHAAPELSLPVNAATGVTNTITFTWTSFASGLHMVYFNGPAGSPDFFVLTIGNSVTIPDLTSLGMGLPVATGYMWVVYGFAPFANMDAAAGPNGFLSGYISLPTGDTYIGLSSSRTFTTAP
jgi:hypothetical protein